jgi:mono/diheme cytochrome c family protein
MNYPVWLIPSVGGGLLIAIISIVHVYVAHFAIGGGLFLVLTEMKGYREDSKDIIDYAKRHTRFFLLLTMVFGSITGVGIWFIISIVHPSATSELIHTFVFGWATEWAFFVGEIVSLFVYFYTFGRMERRNHLLIGWLYFIFAWLSLFVINGIVAFMLTPGAWPMSGNFWDGLFNPTFFPSLFFRTLLALMFAGIFGFLTSTSLKDKALRETMTRYCARWLLVPVILIPVFSYWYLNSITDPSRNMILGRSPEIIPFFKAFIWIMPVLFLGGLIMSIRMPSAVKRPFALVLLVIGLLYMGSFEWIRESARRPYVIYGYMYSNSALKSKIDGINREGILKKAKWVKNKTLSGSNARDAGREIFNIQCLPCHTVGGLMNDILPITDKFTLFGMDSMLNGIGRINNYMAPFMGTTNERMALASYIVHDLHKKAEVEETVTKLPQLPTSIPSFDQEKDEYVLLAWNDLGMHCITDSYRYLAILPPGNNLYVQLIKRGELPEIVVEGVDITYKVEPGFERPSEHVVFWKFAESLFGRNLEPDMGLAGKGMSGSMNFKERLRAFEAELIPIVPYGADGSYNPYPLFTVEAKDKNTGKLLAKTRCVTPVSTQLGCNRCHGGSWRIKGETGLSNETAMDILSVHDRMSRTDLLESAERGKPTLCQRCHSDPAINAEGKPGVLNLSAAMHGLHANYLTGRGDQACNSCHPSHPNGRTRCFRGVHARMGLTCISCHGTLEDHALSLLLKEQKAGKRGAERLMRHLRPRLVDRQEEIKPRTPWMNEPDCLNCHVDFKVPERNVSGFNQWTKGPENLYRLRADGAGILCQGCHGNTHAVYPARNPYGKDRDVIQPMQYQKNPYPIGANKNCRVCHTVDMEDEMHHPNSLRMVRNTLAE